MVKKIFIIIILLMSFTLSASLVIAQENLLSFNLTTALNMPFGDDADYLKYGGSLDFNTDFKLPVFPRISIFGGIESGVNPLAASTAVSFNSLKAGVGFNYPITWNLIIYGYGSAGYYYGFLLNNAASSGGNLCTTFGFGIDYFFIPSWGIGLDASYNINFQYPDSFSIGIRSTFIPLKVDPIRIYDIKINNIFPVLFKYYDSHPIGEAVLENTSTAPLDNVNVTFFVDKYMDNPSECMVIQKLDGGKNTEIIINALFNEKVLNITEGTKVSGKLKISYDQQGKKHTKDITRTLIINNRNAITWDDDQKAAAYVTPKEPVVLEMAKIITSLLKEQQGIKLNKNFCLALGLYETIRLYGVRYVVDPTTPYEQFAKDELAIDYLQFPIQTLKYKAGDCDDLSILYSALLESIGIETAFITVPGHIYIAVSLDMDPEKAKSLFSSHEDLIFKEDKTWLPLEVTILDKSFITAWQTGAEEWQRYAGTEDARFIPIHNAWKTYEPVGFEIEKMNLNLPDNQLIYKEYQTQLDVLLNKELSPRIKTLEQKMRASNRKYIYKNQMAILYAQYGMIDKAEALFKEVLVEKSYMPAMVNLGNIYYIKNDYVTAVKYYKQAADKSKHIPKLLLQLSRVYYKLKDYTKAKEYYLLLENKNPALAEKYAFLGNATRSTSRAAEITGSEEILWQEE